MSVTLYSTPTCPYCKLTKEFFKEKQIVYTDINVEKNGEAAKEMVQRSGQLGVPVIVIAKEASKTGREEVIVGFDRETIASTLGIPV